LDEQREVVSFHACQELGIEVVAVLVAHVDVSRSPRIRELRAYKRCQMVVTRELEPREIIRAVRGKPGIHHNYRPLCLDGEAGMT